MGTNEYAAQSTATVGAIQALATGLMDAGVSMVTGYPGFHAHELVDLCGGTFSVNERTAFGMAWGASAVGARTAVALKNVGLNDAADPFLNAMRLRIAGGMVLVVFDDVEVAGSQCHQDSRPYFDLAPGLWFEPVDVPHAYWCARQGVVASERFGIPVVIRITNPLLRTRGEVTRTTASTGRGIFRRNPAGQVAHPVNARAQEQASARRQSEIADYVETLYSWLAPVRGELCLVAGACGTDGNAEHAGSRRVVWTYPLPERRLKQALASACGLDVYELGDTVVAGKVRSMLGVLPVRSRDMLSAVDHSANYRVSDANGTLFGLLRTFPDRIVCGDLGSYTMDTARTIDLCLSYGASLPVAAGCALAAPDKTVFCVTGDAAFAHSGQACLREIRVRGARVVLIIIDNGRAASTGGQLIPAVIDLPAGVPLAEVEHAHASSETYRRVLNQLIVGTGLSVLWVRC